MVVGAILDDDGRPICCEMWPGNTADVKSLLPVVERLRSRFKIQRFCIVDDRRYIVCRNSKQARKDAAAREAMVAALEEKVRNNPKALVGNRGYARFIKVTKGGVVVDREKIDAEARFDGKWVLRTNMADFSAEQVATKYKELWQVEHVFRDVKSVLDTRPIP